MSTALEPKVVKLHVAYVGHGGNGADGKYFYRYTPSFVPVSDKDTTINYSLDDSSSERYQIYDYAINDPGSQIYNDHLDKETGKLSLTDSCTKNHQLILLSILVQDTQTGEIIDCDPQVTNVPPPQ